MLQPQQQHPQPQPQQIQTQIQMPLQAQTSRPPSQSAPVPPEIPQPSCSPKPPQVHPAQFHFAQPGGAVAAANAAAANAASTAGIMKQLPQLLGLTPEQQRNLQLISSQVQTLSAIAQPNAQQKQLLERLQQVGTHSKVFKRCITHP